MKPVRTQPRRWWERIPKVALTSIDESEEEQFTRDKVAKWLDNPVLSHYLLLVATGFLLAIGLAMVFSASTIKELDDNVNPYRAFWRPVAIAVVGVIGLAIARFIPATWYQRSALVIWLVTLGGQALILTPLRISEGGNTNWIFIPGINQSLQPSEFLKIGYVIYLGALFSRADFSFKDWRYLVARLGLPTLATFALVLYGKDLGTALIFAAVLAGVVFIAGLSWRAIGLVSIAGAGAAAFAVMISASRRARVYMFLTGAGTDPQGRNLQPIHARWGLGTGGFFGTGPGASRQKWGFLPAAQSDYIYAIIGEEFGLIGTLTILAFYAALAYGMYRIVVRHTNTFVRFTTAATMCWIIGQALLNIMVVVGLAPVVGVPLPLISSGGSALLSTLWMMGIIMGFARTEPGALEVLQMRRRRRNRTKAVVGTGKKYE